MEKTKFSFLSDILLIFLLSVATIFTVMRFYLKNTALSIVAAIAISSLIALFYAQRFVGRHKAFELKKKNADEYEIFCDKIRFLSDVKLLKILESIEEFKEYHIEAHIGYVTVEEKDVCDAVKKSAGKKVAYFADGFTDGAKDLAARLGKNAIDLFDLGYLYENFLTKFDFPDKPILAERKKTKFRELVISSFDRKKVKGYSFYGIALLAMSYFAFYPVWYIFSGCLFLLYACAIVVFGKKGSA